MDDLRAESRLSQQDSLEPTPPPSEASHNSSRREHGFDASCDAIEKKKSASFLSETMSIKAHGKIRDST